MVSRLSGLERKKAVWGYVFIAPALILLAAVAVYPLMETMRISLHEFSLLSPADRKFIGFANYATMLRDERFWNSLLNTVLFSFSSVALEFVLGLLLALLMNLPFRWIGAVRAAALVPWAIPTVVSATMWLWMYNDQWGIINVLLDGLGIIDGYQAWLTNPATALPAVIVADVWKTTPFMALLILAGLQMIPKDLYESAAVDGATGLRRFFSITLPMLRSTILVAVLFRTLDSFRVFDLIYVTTMGGPGTATEVTSMYAYKVLFKNLDFGYGSALAMSIMLVVAAVSAIYISVLSEREAERG
jgi:ABC-type sugar transport systems, permease components